VDRAPANIIGHKRVGSRLLSTSWRSARCWEWFKPARSSRSSPSRRVSVRAVRLPATSLSRPSSDHWQN